MTIRKVIIFRLRPFKECKQNKANCYKQQQLNQHFEIRIIITTIVNARQTVTEYDLKIAFHLYYPYNQKMIRAYVKDTRNEQGASQSLNFN